MKQDFKSKRQDLADASRILLQPTSSHLELLGAVRAMSAIYEAIGGLADPVQPAENAAASQLSDGTAIAPRDAARCLLDYYRTAQFVRGLRQAIERALQRFPGQPIEIVYAGCGPYAALALPLCTCFAPSQIRFTLIDFHQHSLDMARRLVEALGFGDFVHDYIRADATAYRHPKDRPLHIVLTETMQKALAKEPQFAITAHLVPQLSPGGLLVPEAVAIDFCLGDLSLEFQFADGAADSGESARQARVRLGRERLLTLSAQSVGALAQQARFDPACGERVLPAVAVQVPALDGAANHAAMLLTHIKVFGAIELDDYDSGLTYPAIMHAIGPQHGGKQLEFRYRLGATPGFGYKQSGASAPGGGDHWL